MANTAAAATPAKSPKKKTAAKPKKPSAHPKYSEMVGNYRKYQLFILVNFQYYLSMGSIKVKNKKKYQSQDICKIQ
jgi:hypothetical protein